MQCYIVEIYSTLFKSMCIANIAIIFMYIFSIYGVHSIQIVNDNRDTVKVRKAFTNYSYIFLGVIGWDELQMLNICLHIIRSITWKLQNSNFCG